MNELKIVEYNIVLYEFDATAYTSVRLHVDNITFSKIALVSNKSSLANRKASSLKATCSLKATSAVR